MIKCDFCVASWYDDSGKVHAHSGWCTANNCADAIRTMSEVMKEEFKELEKIALQEDLERLSVEDIMNISGCGKEFAQVYYDSIHGLNMTSPVSAEEYLQMLKRGEF